MFWKSKVQKIAAEWSKMPSDPVSTMMSSGSSGLINAMNRSQQIEKDWLQAIADDPSYMSILKYEGADVSTLQEILKACMGSGVMPAEVALRLSDKRNLQNALQSWKTTSKAEFAYRVMEMR
jgi:hypothetical protein